MRLATNAECDEWTARHAGQPELRVHHRRQPERQRIVFRTPAAAAQQAPLARYLGSLLGGEESLVRAIDWPLYLPHEMEQFVEWRLSMGHDGRLIDWPGHVFGPTVHDSVQRWILISLLMAFTWQAYAYSSIVAPSIWLADEVIDIVVDADDRQEVLDRLGEFRVDII